MSAVANAYTLYTYDGSVTHNGSIYRIFHTGVTSMTYYYLYNNGWRLIGVGAAADIIRDDYFAGNVNGTPRTELNTVNFKITTNGILRNYIDTYLNYMSTNPSYCLTNELGKLQVNGYSNSLNYTPAYASRPAELVK